MGSRSTGNGAAQVYAVAKTWVNRALRADGSLFTPGNHIWSPKRLRPQPDLSWWDGNVCTFVGDAKYKNVEGKKNVPAGDLYQLLAYATALDLPGGLLIYAKGEAEENEYAVRHADKRLEVASLDLSCPIDEILMQVRGLAKRILDLRNETSKIRGAA